MKHCTLCKVKYDDSVSFCPVDGEVLEDDPSSIVDTVLDGQYQIESMLGKGGMGAVYRARHILLGDRVAIKILPPEVRTNAEWLRRFRREGQAARRFRHPNAVTVYDLRTAADGTIYMVMEHVEGHTLGHEMKARGPMTPVEAFEILEPIMSVLNTAHAMGVVHRDLKPENIMIGKSSTGEPVVKLLDLGIAKMREVAGADGGGATALTLAGQVLGTPHYMSPEQWGELPSDGDSEIDGRADIYSLGLVFYEMIAGKRPYSGLTLHELRREHISVVPRPLHEAVPGVSRFFGEVIARATSKDRGDRQATAGELAAALRGAIDLTTPDRLSRTVPDLPHIEASRSDTSNIPNAGSTESDLNAPTIMTLESSATMSAIQSPAPRVAAPSAALPAQGTSAPTPAGNSERKSVEGLSPIVAPADMSSSVTIPQAPKPQLTQPTRRGPMMLIGAGVLGLGLLIVGVGGFFAVDWLTGKSDNTAEVIEKKNLASNGTTGVETKNLGRYWLELLPESLTGEPVRVAGVVPLASEQSFKFNFVFSEDGYLYIIGPGEKNRLTAFLTAKPPALSGLETNQVSKDVGFSFPRGLENWLKLDKKAGTEDYTIIFSPTPLNDPEFLGAEANGEPLTREEQMELTSFVAKYKTNLPESVLNDQNANQPFMELKVPKVGPSGNPVVFDIRIQHK
ncbi:MAG: protein kinase [Pyrinomonadaceae bacterium]|nr:protein kinase [Pyrinomonadaceae bacterium]